MERETNPEGSPFEACWFDEDPFESTECPPGDVPALPWLGSPAAELEL
jgi:hypothetical protein